MRIVLLQGTNFPAALGFRTGLLRRCTLTRKFFALCGVLLPAEALSQGQGSWGGATGLVQAGLVVIAVAFLAWAALCFFIARSLARHPAIRFLLTVVFAFAPAAYIGHHLDSQSRSFNNGLNELAATNSQLRASAESYAASKCATLRKLTPPAELPSPASFVLVPNGDAPPPIADVPPPEPLTESMKEQMTRYGESYPHGDRQKQYRSPLSWARQVFLESRPDAPYLVRFQDISTREDRDNWVARGRIALERRADGALLAEYVGFAANRSPVFRGYGYPWESVSVCSGAEQKYLDKQSGRWDAQKFFLNEMIRITQ